MSIIVRIIVVLIMCVLFGLGGWALDVKGIIEHPAYFYLYGFIAGTLVQVIGAP